MTHPWHQSIDLPEFLKPLSSHDELVLPGVLDQHRDLALARAQLPADPALEVDGCPYLVRLAFGVPVDAGSVIEALAWHTHGDTALTWPLSPATDPNQMSEAMEQELAVVLTLLRAPDLSRAWRLQDDFSIDVLDAIMARGLPVALRAALAAPTCPSLESLQARHGQASMGFKHPRTMPWLHAAIVMDSPLASILLEHGFDPCQRDYKGQPAWALASSATMLDTVLAHIHAPLSREDLILGLTQWANGPGKSTYAQRVEVLLRHAYRWRQPEVDLDVTQAMVLVQRRNTPLRDDGRIGWAGEEVTAAHLQSLSVETWRTLVIEPSWPLEDKRMTLADAVAWRTMSESYPAAQYGVGKVLAGLPDDVHSASISNLVPGLFLRHTVMLVEQDTDQASLRAIGWVPEVVQALSYLVRTPVDARRGPGLHVTGLVTAMGAWAQTWKMVDKVNPATWDALHEVVQQTRMDLSQASPAWNIAVVTAAHSPRLTHEGACAMGRMLVTLFNHMNVEGNHGIHNTQRKGAMKALDLLLQMEPCVSVLGHPRLPIVIEALVADRDDASDWAGLKVRLRARVLETQWPEEEKAGRPAPGARL